MGETAQNMEQIVEGFPENLEQARVRFFGILAGLEFDDDLDKMAMVDYFQHWFAEYDRANDTRPEMKMQALSFISNNSHSCSSLAPLTVLIHAL